MRDAVGFGSIVALAGLVGLAAVLSSHLSSRTRIPSPALFLVGGAIAANAVSNFHVPSERLVERVVTVAVALILFDGGLHLGWNRLRRTAGTVLTVGLVGTLLTGAALAVAAHLLLDVSWYLSLLVGTALAPTDPAVVFSVLGKREISGLSGALLEGESGANDPVGIALTSALLGAGSVQGGALGHAALEFGEQIVIGAAFAAVGAIALLWMMRRVPLPSEGLYPLRVLVSVLLLFGLTTLAHGSGFLAVFGAGIAIGDAGAPYKREIVRFHSALASLGEIVAFVMLGLTVNFDEISRSDVWLPALAIWAVLTILIRPALVGPCLLRSPLRPGERGFVLFAGLKGAVPILLGSFLLSEHVAHAGRLYAVILIVVTLSVLVQGGLVTTVARLAHVQMRDVEPEPWSLGVRLLHEPQGAQLLTIARGSAADGRRIDDFDSIAPGVWLSMIVRNGQLLPIEDSTVLTAGDEILVLASPDQEAALRKAVSRSR
ncbi:MAG TPA: cation:proton antiporter [Mycobacteriales bacterium]|nr:cation:proton antiporter [Mycobacteriales bacterium]